MAIDNNKETFYQELEKLPDTFNVRECAFSPGVDNEEYRDWWKILIEIPITSMGKTDFPLNVEVTIFIEPPYPFSKYAVFPNDLSIRGFPHQDAETGKLCLWNDEDIDFSNNRLWQIILSTLEWMKKASQVSENNYDALGILYELPDFSRKEYPYGEMPIVFFQENANSFEFWKDKYKTYGMCSLIPINEKISFIEEYHILKDTNYKYKWGNLIEMCTNRKKGLWILIDHEPTAMRKRPFQTFGEFKELLLKYGLIQFNIDRLIKEKKITVNNCFPKNHLIVLLGFPIPEIYGGNLVEIHWQPFTIPLIGDTRHRSRKGYRRGFSPIKSDSILGWGRSFNIDYDRYFGRGCLNKEIINLKIGIIGYGAIGSILTNFLIREGVNEIIIVDGETIIPGNLCRNSSFLYNVGMYKVEDAIDQLLMINPYLKIDIIKNDVPINKTVEYSRLSDCDLIFDCTAEAISHYWLELLRKEYGNKIIIIYITNQAKYLCAYGTGNKLPLDRIKLKLDQYAKSEKIPKDFSDYISDEELFSGGVGCWHPTFPAKLHEISILISFFLSRLNGNFLKMFNNDWGIIIGLSGNGEFGNPPKLISYFEGEIE